MMTKSPAAKSVQTQLWKPLLSDLVNPKHELVLLPGPSTGRASRPSWDPPTRRTTAVRRVRSGCSRGKARKRYEIGVKTGLVTSALLLDPRGADVPGQSLRRTHPPAVPGAGGADHRRGPETGLRRPGIPEERLRRIVRHPDREPLQEDSGPEPATLVEAAQRHRTGHRARTGGPLPRRPLPTRRKTGRRPPRPADRRRLQPPQADEGAQAPLFVPFPPPPSDGLACPLAGSLIPPTALLADAPPSRPRPDHASGLKTGFA